ncbi:hypothetical protein L7F22_007919 [Adiantum nelumboides]|nr:hypothetical protein [Adiantum nelumboides]
MYRQLSVERPRPSYRLHDIFHSAPNGLSPCRFALPPNPPKAFHILSKYVDSRSLRTNFLLGISSFSHNAPAPSLGEKIISPTACKLNIEGLKPSPSSVTCEVGGQELKLLPITSVLEKEEGCASVSQPEKFKVNHAELCSRPVFEEEPEACFEEDAIPLGSTCNVEDTKLLSGHCSRRLSADMAASRGRSRADRRRKTTAFARNIQNELPDLLAVPGIGPRNLEKLVAKGIGKVAELKQLYRDKFINDESQKMVEFLQSSVGIVHKNHAESITTYVKNCVDKEQKEQSSAGKESCNGQKKKVTICVEGNISVGKTTFLRKIASEIIQLRDLVEIVPEPVDKWKDVGPDHFNLLDAFYNEPERYAYTFQNYVFATRLMKEQETSNGMKPLRLMERSIFSDRLVFVRAVHEAKWMSELELRIYESWFDPFISALPGLVPDGFIYLRASPDTCLRRLHLRNRPEERGVTLDYLKGLHEKHEQCFFPSERTGGVYSVNPVNPHWFPLPPRIKDRVFYLEGDHLHSSIKKVPALILDCEASIDFNRDLEARAEYAQQVAEFYEYIRSNKDFPRRSETGPSGSSNPFSLPYTGRLFKPDSIPFLHGHPLDLNFGKRSSTLCGIS